MQEVRRFVVNLPPEETSSVRRALNRLADTHSVKIEVEKGEVVEFSCPSPEYALFKINILSPTAVVREMRNGTEKEVAETLPIWIEGLIKCPNKNCITAQPKEPTKPKFKVVSTRPPKVQCFYCGRYVDPSNLISQLI